MKWEEELELAIRTAREAGAHLRDAMTRHKTVLSSIGKDIKLQADLDAEAIILEALSASEYPILAEESGEHDLSGGDAPFWVVDPLDGTLNFSRGIPMCCVSIALCRGDESILGVIYDFNRDECFRGIADGEAWVDDQPLSVSDVTDVSKAVLASGFPAKTDLGDAALHTFVKQAQQFKKVRFFGTAALSLAYVACGRVEAYAEDDIMLWDVAAGIALVRAAGGDVQMKDSPAGKWCRHVRCASSPAIWRD